MTFVARTATPADLHRLVAELDQQFVFGKGRRLSLAQRFPAVYCPENAGNIFLLEEKGEILSCLACKLFHLQYEGNEWRGAMIGGVYTRAERRGEGLASSVVGRSADALRKSGMDFAVLWTDQPGFYARLGWTLADRGMLGELENPSNAPASRGEVAAVPAPAGNHDHIERLRARWGVRLTPRRADHYRQLPLPADDVNLLVSGRGTEHAAYALLGTSGDTGIVYELIGYPGRFPALWPEVCRGHRRILVNDVSGSPSQRWLSQNAGLAWQPKPLAMWLPLSTKADVARTGAWYIPYFDRI